MAAPKLTPQLTKKLTDLFEHGHTINGACGLIGIHRDTYYGWMEKGTAARALREHGKPVPRTESRYLAFLEKVELARDHGEGWLVERLLEAIVDPKTRGQWQGYMTMLERTRPDRFRRRAAAEYIKAQPTSPAQLAFDPAKLTNDELDALEVLLEKARLDER